MDTDAQRAATLYSQYGGVADRGTWAPTMGHLRFDAHGARGFAARGCSKRVVYLAGLHGHVHGPCHSMAVPGVPGNRTRAGTGNAGDEPGRVTRSGRLRRKRWARYGSVWLR